MRISWRKKLSSFKLEIFLFPIQTFLSFWRLDFSLGLFLAVRRLRKNVSRRNIDIRLLTRSWPRRGWKERSVLFYAASSSEFEPRQFISPILIEVYSSSNTSKQPQLVGTSFDHFGMTKRARKRQRFSWVWLKTSGRRSQLFTRTTSFTVTWQRQTSWLKPGKINTRLNGRFI